MINITYCKALKNKSCILELQAPCRFFLFIFLSFQITAISPVNVNLRHPVYVAVKICFKIKNCTFSNFTCNELEEDKNFTRLIIDKKFRSGLDSIVNNYKIDKTFLVNCQLFLKLPYLCKKLYLWNYKAIEKIFNSIFRIAYKL